MNVEFKNKTKNAVKLRSWSEGTYNNAIVSETTQYPYIKDVGEPPTPVRPDVPQSGTWQLKTTSNQRYVIFGTDDDNNGDAWYYRLLRSYGIPYTMNVEAENAKTTRNMGNDTDTLFFTESDAPSLFPNGTNVIELGKYLNEHGSEVAQHGSSEGTLWDSANLSGTFLDGIYATYTGAGGTRTKDELKSAIMEQLKATDISQGASYVEESRDVLEEAFGFYIMTAGIWGGEPIAVIDDIELSLNPIKAGGSYDWRAHNYTAASYDLKYTIVPNNSPHKILRGAVSLSDIPSMIDTIKYGHIYEFFCHSPKTDFTSTEWRELFETIAGMSNVTYITRKAYAELGEYVDDAHAIQSVSITCNKQYYTEDDTPSASDFTCTVTYKDDSIGYASADKIIDISSIDVTTDGFYPVTLYYRGFESTINVVVQNSSIILPEFPTGYYYEIAKCTDNNYYFLIVQSANFATGSSAGSNTWVWHGLIANTCYSFISTDMQTWTKLKDASSGIANIKSNLTDWWGDATIISKNFETIVSVTQR